MYILKYKSQRDKIVLKIKYIQDYITRSLVHETVKWVNGASGVLANRLMDVLCILYSSSPLQVSHSFMLNIKGLTDIKCDSLFFKFLIVQISLR